MLIEPTDQEKKTVLSNWHSGTYPFLDIGIVRCDWLRSKPKQSKFGRELLEMSRSETNF